MCVAESILIDDIPQLNRVAKYINTIAIYSTRVVLRSEIPSEFIEMNLNTPENLKIVDILKADTFKCAFEWMWQ